jgi:predicted ArsR family transcriptional regulator
VEPKFHSTKDKILELLKKTGFMSVNDLTERLDITHMAIRKHLNQLEKGDLIQSSELKQPMGRPLHLYSLTDRGERLFPKNYEGITLEFLRDLENAHGAKLVEELFKKREERLTEEISARLTHLPNSDKVKELVRIQNEKGYMADFTQPDANSFELVEHNCPILAVAKEYTVACSCETRMFQEILTTAKVTRTSCKTEGDHACKFSIQY